jgi:C4-dicarboxylate-specific signal transduction histidine kinase
MVADSQRAGEVIRGIRRLVRKEKGARALLDLNAVISDTIRLLSSDVLMRESVVTPDLEDNLPQVEAVPVQIQQVLLNLIMNSLDAVEALPPNERRIIVSTRSIDHQTVEVSVRDFGAGLPGDNPEKVFDHFFSTKQQGMGMGLAIVRSIVESHDGTISAENVRDGGARFSFRLPSVHTHPKSQAA